MGKTCGCCAEKRDGKEKPKDSDITSNMTGINSAIKKDPKNRNYSPTLPQIGKKSGGQDKSRNNSTSPTAKTKA